VKPGLNGAVGVRSHRSTQSAVGVPAGLRSGSPSGRRSGRRTCDAEVTGAVVLDGPVVVASHREAGAAGHEERDRTVTVATIRARVAYVYALSPVNSLPTTSFWMSVVPSGTVMVRASR